MKLLKKRNIIIIPVKLSFWSNYNLKGFNGFDLFLLFDQFWGFVISVSRKCQDSGKSLSLSQESSIFKVKNYTWKQNSG